MKKTLAVSVLVLAAAAAGAEQKVDRTLKAPADGVVAIENVAGSVKVSPWDRDEVSVTGTLGDEVKELRFVSDGRRTEIEVKLPEGRLGRKSGDRMAAHLEVKVPATSGVEVEAVSATVTATGLKGALDVETVSGSIDVDTASRKVQAEAVSGTVTVKGASGHLVASTVSGILRVEGGTFDHVELETVSGSLTFAGALSPKATLDAESVSGTVDLLFPASVSARFDVETLSGDVTNQLGPAAERSHEFGPGKELSFKAGAGDATVEVETVSGDVALRKK